MHLLIIWMKTINFYLILMVFWWLPNRPPIAIAILFVFISIIQFFICSRDLFIIITPSFIIRPFLPLSPLRFITRFNPTITGWYFERLPSLSPAIWLEYTHFVKTFVQSYTSITVVSLLLEIITLPYMVLLQHYCFLR